MKKNGILMAICLIMTANALAQAPYANSGDHAVCVSTQNYGVSATAGSTYEWKLEPTGTSTAAGATLNTATGALTSVDWLQAGTYDLSIQETSADLCVGPWSTIHITVNPLPEQGDETASACSNEAIGFTLPITDDNGLTLTSWVIKSINIPAGVTADAGNATIGTYTNASALASDQFLNSNSTTAQVVYTITPYAGDCPGADFTLTVNVFPNLTAPVIYHE
ncbi:MAG: hypothetical protein J5808_06260 [Paludibacteraceae bacterium]|nr:hypothetical protein [Paludibacteraceae bacterium]